MTGDDLAVDIDALKPGDASWGLEYTLRGDDGVRLVTKSIIVLTDLDSGRPVPIKDELRAALSSCLKKQ